MPGPKLTTTAYSSPRIAAFFVPLWKSLLAGSPGVRGALTWSGGQERGLRPGTLPVPLVVGIGLAAELAIHDAAKRNMACESFLKKLLSALSPLTPRMIGDANRTVPHTLNISFPGLDSEAVMVALKDVIAISNGSACTSQSYQPSHVLKAMGLTDEDIHGALRFSWSHMTEDPDWDRVVQLIKQLN